MVGWLLISIPCLTIATFFSLQGLWPILPFAGVEVLLLLGAFYASSLRQHSQEHIVWNDHELMLARVRGRRAQRICWPRAWTRIRIEEPLSGWYPSRLYLEYSGQREEIGSALSDKERRLLLASLEGAGFRIARTTRAARL